MLDTRQHTNTPIYDSELTNEAENARKSTQPLTDVRDVPANVASGTAAFGGSSQAPLHADPKPVHPAVRTPPAVRGGDTVGALFLQVAGNGAGVGLSA